MDIRTYIRDFVHLFFPQLCRACDQCLLAHETILCTHCLYHLPLTDFHLDSRNETVQQLWGKSQVEFAISMLHLAKSSRVEHLLHQLKYKNQPDIGVFLGQYYANLLQDFVSNYSIDFIIPIPIHPKKLHIRGYNQSTCFAEGLSSGLGIPVALDVLIRTRHTDSQTSKSRNERYENVKDVFACTHPEKLVGKHVLLVDDILTTGATICAAANVLVAAKAKVSIATIARA